jgi:hypothetical protein
MSRPQKLSDEAQAADTTESLWSLYFTDEILDKIVRYTNESIQAEIETMQYTANRMYKSPYIRDLDKVNLESSQSDSLINAKMTISKF